MRALVFTRFHTAVSAEHVFTALALCRVAPSCWNMSGNGKCTSTAHKDILHNCGPPSLWQQFGEDTHMGVKVIYCIILYFNAIFKKIWNNHFCFCHFQQLKRQFYTLEGQNSSCWTYFLQHLYKTTCLRKTNSFRILKRTFWPWPIHCTAASPRQPWRDFYCDE